MDLPSSSPSASPRASVSGGATAEQVRIIQLEQQVSKLILSQQQIALQQQQATAQQQQQQQQQAPSHASAAAPRAPELPRIRQPSSFSGSMGSMVDDWISELQQQFAYYGGKFPDDLSKVRFAVAYLTGAAMHWWEHQDQPAITTWAGFVLALHGRFRPVHAAMLARQKLGKLRFVNVQDSRSTSMSVCFRRRSHRSRTWATWIRFITS
jgi:hypothetical protein